MNNFGYDRVIEPKKFIPISAWRINNSKKIKSKEVRLKISLIKLEEGNFRQLCNICGYDEEKIKARILDIVKKRGKLHNPATDSGGICYGMVEEIGKNYRGKEAIKIGDNVICLTSLTAIPIYIDKIKAIHFNYSQIEIEGYAILFDATPIIKAPEDMNLNCAMYAFDESGSVAKACKVADKGDKFLILGSEILSILIYSAAIRQAAGDNKRVVAVIDQDSVKRIGKRKIEEILKKYVDKVYLADVLDAMGTYKMLQEKEFQGKDDFFDVSIHCGNLLGAEIISVLLTREKGTLFFTSLINNYNLILLFAESLGKSVNVISMEEYAEGFPEFTAKLMRMLKEPLDEIDRLYRADKILNKLPTSIVDAFQYENAGKFDDYVFRSVDTGKMLEDVINIASYDCSVIIHGETGVGKEKILELIHKNSSRRTNPCIRINCATIQDNLAESEFFGYDAGAFTGASVTGKQGYFEMANNGVLFLDEVGELSPALQTKLLRVIQENQFYKVGGQTPIKVNVRVICASNVSLRELVKEGKFREDLYYRLNICEINVLPLRERKEDILSLAEYFLSNYNEKYMQNKNFDEEAVMEMMNYSWPGNVRELENTIHRAIISNKSDIIGGERIKDAISKNLYPEKKENDKMANINYESLDLNHVIEKHEKALIEEALRKEGTTRKAAKILGISQSQLMRKKNKYGL